MGRIRRNGKRIGAVVASLVLVALIAFFIREYQNAGGGSHAAQHGSGAGTPSDSASPSPGQAGAGIDPATLPETLPPYTVTPAEPGGFVFADLPKHRLVMSASSAAAIGVVGYLVPTSSDHSYGKSTGVGTRWSMSTYVYGKPYYAAVFVQAGRSGAVITCTITVDGKTTSSRSTSGAYGRQVCVG